MTVPEVAARLDISDRRVRALIASGRLKATRRGRDWWITEAALNAYEPRGAGRPRKSDPA